MATLTIPALFASVILILIFAYPSHETALDLRAMILYMNPSINVDKVALFYGCYCGPGGAGTPVDDIDACCKAHDECYRLAHCWLPPVVIRFNYTSHKGVISCTNPDRCAQDVCACDVRVAECLQTKTVPANGPKCKDYDRTDPTQPAKPVQPAKKISGFLQLLSNLFTA